MTQRIQHIARTAAITIALQTIVAAVLHQAILFA